MRQPHSSDQFSSGNQSYLSNKSNASEQFNASNRLNSSNQSHFSGKTGSGNQVQLSNQSNNDNYSVKNSATSYQNSVGAGNRIDEETVQPHLRNKPNTSNQLNSGNKPHLRRKLNVSNQLNTGSQLHFSSKIGSGNQSQLSNQSNNDNYSVKNSATSYQNSVGAGNRIDEETVQPHLRNKLNASEQFNASNRLNSSNQSHFSSKTGSGNQSHLKNKPNASNQLNTGSQSHFSSKTTLGNQYNSSSKPNASNQFNTGRTLPNAKKRRVEESEADEGFMAFQQANESSAASQQVSESLAASQQVSKSLAASQQVSKSLAASQQVSKSLAACQADEGLTARQAFLKAFHVFQKIYIPPRREHSYINEAGVEVKYVTLDALLNHIRPYLVKAGLCVHWEDIYLKQGAVHVTCIAAHHLGGERMCRLALPLATQEHRISLAHSMAGTVTLAKRYALMALLGLSVEEADVPKKASPAEADVHYYAKPKPASVIVLRDSVQRPPVWADEDKKRAHGGVAYKKIVTLYHSKLQQLRSLGVLGVQAAKPFVAFADFIEAGEPSFDDIVKYGRRLSEVLRKSEASLKADLPVLVRGRRSLKSPTPTSHNHLSTPTSKNHLSASASNNCLNASASNNHLSTATNNNHLNASASNNHLSAATSNNCLSASASNNRLSASASNNHLSASASNNHLSASASHRLNTLTSHNHLSTATTPYFNRVSKRCAE
ncbi:hypothetical protein COTS27_01612 [Spirochaetota bacterium]|nr:hypothetical protein COTS27_01612 [Spirochaetota bacterium]